MDMTKEKMQHNYFTNERNNMMSPQFDENSTFISNKNWNGELNRSIKFDTVQSKMNTEPFSDGSNQFENFETESNQEQMLNQDPIKEKDQETNLNNINDDKPNTNTIYRHESKIGQREKTTL